MAYWWDACVWCERWIERDRPGDAHTFCSDRCFQTWLAHSRVTAPPFWRRMHLTHYENLMALFGVRFLIRVISLTVTAGMFYFAFRWDGPVDVSCAFITRVAPTVFGLTLPC
jgi:hypothetical protein